MKHNLRFISIKNNSNKVGCNCTSNTDSCINTWVEKCIRKIAKQIPFFSVLLFFSFINSSIKAQVSSYSFSQTNGTYVPITGGVNNPTTSSTTSTTYLDDNNVSALPIGFSFTYNGTSYTQFGYNANGWIILGSGVPLSSYTSISDAAQSNIISAMNNDLIGRGSFVINRTSGSPTVTVTSGDISLINVGDYCTGTGITAGSTVVSKTATTITLSNNASSTGSGSHLRYARSTFGIRYETIGSAPNRKLVVQWTGFQRYTTTAGNGELYNFQIVLNETTNVIDIIYNIQGPTATTSTTYQVGLKGTTNSDYNNRTTITDWSASTAGIANNSSMTFSNTVKPNSGLTFTFTPPVLCAGTPIAGTIPTANSVCAGSTVGVLLTVSGYSTGVTGITFQWQDSSAGGAWANATGGSGATTASYTTPSLSATKYYRCKVTCSASSLFSYTNVSTVDVTNCTFDVSYSTGASFVSIMPANGGNGLAMPGWQSTTSGDDNTSTTVSLAGTKFKYQGVTVSGFQVCSNGWMTFNTSNSSTAYSNGLTASSPNMILAPFWEDLVFTGQSYNNRDACVRYQIDGTLGSGAAVITIEWAGIERYNIAGPNMNFQVKLYESDNHFEFIYGNFEGFDGTLGTNGYSYSVGYNGTSPSGTTAIDRFAMQTPNSNHFSASSDPANHIIMPDCYSKLTFTSGIYTGPTTAPAITTPTNDNSSGAITLSVNATPCTTYCGTYYTSRGATNSGLGQACGTSAGNEDDDVWFTFTPNLSDNNIQLRCSPNYDGVIQLYDQSMTAITCVNATGLGLTETITATNLNVGLPYFIRVFHNGTSIGSSSGQFSICINEVIPAPSNDNICGAVTLTAALTCNSTNSLYPNTLSSTASPQATCAGTADDDVWYSFVATTNHDTVRVQSGAGYNAHLQVYSSSNNTCSGTLTSLACINNTSTGGLEEFVGTSLVPGNTYFARVYHSAAGVGSGNFSICVIGAVPVCNSGLLPINNGSGNLLGQVLSWTANPTATNYDVYFDQNNPPTTLVSNQTSTSYTTPALNVSQTYYWRVIAKNPLGSSSACTVNSFNTFPPNCVSTYTPTSNAILCTSTSNTNLSWNTEPSAISYDVYFDTLNGSTFVNNQTATTYNVGVLQPGTYYWKVISKNSAGVATGCITNTFTVYQTPTVTASSNSPVCANNNIALTASSSLTNAVYAWTGPNSFTASSNTATINSAAIANAGIYSVSVTVNGCTSSTVTVPVVVNPAPNVNINSSLSSICFGGSSTIGFTKPILTYCTSIHSNSCTGDNMTTVTLNGTPAMSATNSGCGVTTAGAFNYIVDTVNTTTLSAGSTYTMTVGFGTDVNQYMGAWIDYNKNGTFETSEFFQNVANAGASGTLSIPFTVPVSALNGVTRMRIIGGNDNVVLNTQACGASSSGYGETRDYSITITGGVVEFTYAWMPGGATTSAVTVSPTSTSTYTATVTGSNGCSTNLTASITVNTVPVTATASPSSYIIGNSSTITAAGAATYSWADTSALPTLSTNTGASVVANPVTTTTYTVTATSALGCVSTTSVTVTVIIPPLTLNASHLNITCNGNTNGQITALATFGTPPYSYVLNGGLPQSSNVFAGLSAAAYTVKVTDAVNATSTVVVTLTEPASLDISVANTYVKCFGGSNGMSVAAVVGGTAFNNTQYPYLYEWYDAADNFMGYDDTLANLIAGTYYLAVEDSMACRDTLLNITILEPALITGTSSVVACNSYVWNGNTYSTSGIYVDTFTASNTCDSVHTLNLTINNSTNTIVNVTNCNSYTWLLTGQTYYTSGTYNSVTLNASGCSDTVKLVLVINNSNNTTLTTTSCNSYTWAANGLTYTNSGTYKHVTTNSTTGCSDTATLVLTINTTSIAISAGNTNLYTTDTLLLSITAPTLASSFNWSGPNSFVVNTANVNTIVTSANSGTYTATVVGTNGCSATTTVAVNVTPSVLLSLKVLLGGAYSTSTGLMWDSLRTLGIIPTTEPYSSAPYNASYTHINGGGGETMRHGVSSVSGNNAIVDWVFVQLRSQADNKLVLGTKAALVQRDGDVVSTDGVSPVRFRNNLPNQYYVSIEHRNHLGVMTLNKYALGEIPVLLDITNPSLPLYTRPAPSNNPAPLSGPAKMMGSMRVLYPGNCNIDVANAAYRIITYNPTAASDRMGLLSATGATSTILGYTVFDVNMDGKARFNGTNPDRLTILQTTLGTNTIIVNEQTPN